MIALCTSIAAEGVMSYREAWRTPLALLLQIRHALARRHDIPCWHLSESTDASSTLAQIGAAIGAWGDIVDGIEDDI